MGPPPPTLHPEDPCERAVELLRDPAASSVVVVDRAQRLLGIVTEQDIVHRVAFRRPADAPVRAVMSQPLLSIARRDYLFQAIALMRRENMRHLPVVDDHGRLCGIVHLHTALGEAIPSLLEMVDALTPRDMRNGMAQIKQAQVQLAAGLLADATPAPEIQSLLTHFNNDIYRRIIRQSITEMHEAGWGQPPARFDVIVMGSGGRGESYLFPDQDNGFVIEDYPDTEHDRIDAWFIELAGRMTAALGEAGITLCKGYVMATNPLWRKTLTQWCAQLETWLRSPSDATLRLADIFFDFQPVFGSGDKTNSLRRFVAQTLPRRPAYLQRMQHVQRDHGVALGLFNRLTVDRNPGPHEGKLNLKYHGLLPLVEAVRLLALREGLLETSTLQRIAALHGAGVLSADEQDYLSGAYHHITALVLRQQLQDYAAGRPVGAHVPPAGLTERERDMLVDSFEAINALRGRIGAELSGTVF